MNKNLIFITAIEGLVDTSCVEYCVKTWNYWANKNNADVIVFNQSLGDPSYFKPTWQRWYIWKILKENNLDYDKVALVDSDTMIRWDSPNLFENINLNEIGVCSDNDNINWTKKSIDGYKKFFNKTELDWTEYFNAGFVIIGKEQQTSCEKIINFFEKNQKELINLEDVTLGKGTDQTPVNFILKSEGCLKFLNKKWNVTHMNRKEILNDFFFIDCGYVWHFNGFDKSHRTPLMGQTWNIIKKNYEN